MSLLVIGLARKSKTLPELCHVETLRTVGNSGGNSSWCPSSLRLVVISKRDCKSWCEIPFDMEMLGSFERSGLQIRMFFDEEVHFLTMVVGIVLPP